MFHLLVIGAFFIVLLRDELGAGVIDVLSAPGRLMSFGLTVGGLAAIWGVCWGALVLLGRAMDRSGLARLAMAAEILVLLARLAGIAYFLIAVFAFGWVDTIRLTLADANLGLLNGIGVDEFVGVLPALVSIAAGWWVLHPIDRRLREAMLLRDLDGGKAVYALPGRWQATWMACRHHLGIIVIPVGLIIVWGDGVESVAQWWFGVDRIEEARTAVQAGVTIVHLLGTLTIFTFIPPLMCRVWDTAPMRSGETLERLDGMCRRHGVRVRGIRVWSTRGSMVNGAVLGLIARFRYILLTDALLGSLPRREVEAVMAHEIAHVRRRHLLWLAAALLATLVFTLMLGEVLVALVWPGQGAPQVVNLGLTVLVLVLTITAFGFVSRRFEWQADAFAVGHLSESPPPSAFYEPGEGAERVGGSGAEGEREDGGDGGQDRGGEDRGGLATPEAVASMVRALQHVAVLNGIPLKRFTFRHGSIAGRQRRIRRLEGRPIRRLPIDGVVRWIKWGSLLALGCGAAGYAVLLAV